MSTTRHTVQASRDDVWAVLADGWLFPLWVVGASRIREVDGHWPTVGSRLHHSFGLWPLVIDDHTRVVEVETGSRLVLVARGWPAGEAQVDIRVTDEADGTAVVMREQAVKGPGRLVPDAVQDVALGTRNAESLRRLAWLAEGRASRPTPDPHS